MRCEEAAEFVSALCDGELVPGDAAQHMDNCAVCRDRLREYVELGAELRLMASAELLEVAPVREWETKQSRINNLWAKGWQTMRVPRLAFGLLLAAVVVLGSSLVATRARAHGEGEFLRLSVTSIGEKPEVCTLSISSPPSATCGHMGRIQFGNLSYKIKVIGKDGDRIELGVKAQFDKSPSTGSYTLRMSDVDKLPEEHYWFEPGESLKLTVAGLGPMEVMGEWMDHKEVMLDIPNMEPKPNEFRIISPLLLRDKALVLDMQGGSALDIEGASGIELYKQGSGRYRFALSPFEGAVEGKISRNRISFEIDGQSYLLVAGAPIARSERAWVRRDERFVPEDGTGVFSSIGGFKLSRMPDQK